MTTSQFYLSQIVSGVATGCTYGLLALAIVFIYRAAKVGSFVQADLATVTAYLTLSFLSFMHIYFAFLLALALSFLISGAIHVFVIRKVRGKEKIDIELTEVIITVGLSAITTCLIRWFWGSRLRPFPTLFAEGNIEFAQITTTIHSFWVILTTMLISALLWVFFKFTRLGIACEAVSNNRMAAATRGIRVHHVLSFSWGFAAIVGGISGVLAAPILNLHPSMMGNVFMYAFIAAIIGGLKSPVGALVSGVLIGVIENLSGTIELIGSELKTVVIFLILVICLYIKPRGLFGKKEIRKV